GLGVRLGARLRLGVALRRLVRLCVGFYVGLDAGFRLYVSFRARLRVGLRVVIAVAFIRFAFVFASVVRGIACVDWPGISERHVGTSENDCDRQCRNGYELEPVRESSRHVLPPLSTCAFARSTGHLW